MLIFSDNFCAGNREHSVGTTPYSVPGSIPAHPHLHTRQTRPAYLIFPALASDFHEFSPIVRLPSIDKVSYSSPPSQLDFNLENRLLDFALRHRQFPSASHTDLATAASNGQHSSLVPGVCVCRHQRFWIPLPPLSQKTHSIIIIMAEYSSLKVPELKKLLGERGLSQAGVKADLIARLQEHDQSPAEEKPAEKGKAGMFPSKTSIPARLNHRLLTARCSFARRRGERGRNYV